MISEIDKQARGKLSDRECEMCVRLDSVESRHVHLQQPVFPVEPGDPAVMNTPGDVSEIFPILQKAVVFIIHRETRST